MKRWDEGLEEVAQVAIFLPSTPSTAYVIVSFQAVAMCILHLHGRIGMA